MATLSPLHSLLPPSFVYGTIAGFILFNIFYRLSPILTSLLGTKSFQQKIALLKHEDGKFWNYHSLLPSTVHAIAQVVGTYSMVFHGRDGYDLASDATTGTTAAADPSSSPAIIFDDRTIVPYGITHLGPAVWMGIFVGYLVADALSSGSFRVLGFPFAVHHFAASLCWTFSAYFRVMQPVGCLLQFNELSTPLMNVRKYLLFAGYRTSDFEVTVCSLAFFAAFGLVRVAPLPFVVRDWIARDFGPVRNEIGTGGAVLISAFFAVNVLLQFGWFAIMCRKIAEKFGTKPKAKAE